jgi:hypothetical protein
MQTKMDTLRWMKGFFALGLLLTLFTTPGCAGSIQGQVLEAETGKPIAGAVVLGVWTKSVGLLLTHWELLGVREAETDAEGRFVLEQLGRMFVEEQITVYKFGYIAWSRSLTFPGLAWKKDRSMPPEIRLAHFPVGGSHEVHMRFVDLATASAMSRRGWVKFGDGIGREERMR